jgi:hypothetical protein
MSEPVAVRRARIYSSWGLKKSPPFTAVPFKNEPKLLARLFTGRREEMDRLILAILDGRNVLVRGTWGIGKTTFILQALHELVHQAKLINQRLLPIYIDNFKGGDANAFYRVILYALANTLADKDDDAKKLVEALRGIAATYSRTRSMQTKMEVNLLSVVSVSGEVGSQGAAERGVELTNPEYWIETLIERARKRFHNIVIAVDDLDKTDPNPEETTRVQSMLETALPILRSELCSFILTGRTLTVAQDIYGAVLGVFHSPLQLKPLSSNELREIAIKTFNIARAHERDDAYPFSDGQLISIADKSYGIPRQFNRNCAEILDAAVRLGYDDFGQSRFDHCFQAMQRMVGAEVDEQVRHWLYVAHKNGGLSQANRKALDELGMSDFFELLPILDYLIQQDFLVRQDHVSGIRYIVPPRAELAAKLPLPDIVNPEL